MPENFVLSLWQNSKDDFGGFQFADDLQSLNVLSLSHYLSEDTAQQSMNRGDQKEIKWLSTEFLYDIY